MRPINLGTDYEYGVLNIHLTAYDMTLAESYAQYIHNLCNHLSIKVEERYVLISYVFTSGITCKWNHTVYNSLCLPSFPLVPHI